jgi:predicted MPP superfamily phosphohydrolase
MMECDLPAVRRSRRRKYLPAVVVLPALLAAALLAFDTRLVSRHYEIRTPKLTAPVRLAVIADLHSCYYGEGQTKLLDAVDDAAPDAIMLVGDIADDIIPHDNTRIVLEAIGGRYPCYYVTGNHEHWSGEVADIKAMFRAYGVEVLAGASRTLSVGTDRISISGLDDPDGGHFAEQLTAVSDEGDRDGYTVLLSHRPEYADEYAALGFDLVLSGHMHGGLWRIPGLLNGLAAPNGRLFPKYAGGLYSIRETTMIVSRGLALETTRIPRIFNPPELVIVDLIP